MNKQPIVIEHTYNAPAETVWKALTNKDQMKQWYFALEEFKAIPGFEFRFSGGPEDGTQYVHICRVTEVVEGKTLTYSWRYHGYPGISHVSFELFALGTQTRLKLTHSGLETFPDTNKDFAKENFEAGWNQILNVSLQQFLEK
ncbi:MAG: SRPBCC domain-containing protein [Bacteroidetes bacterium]|nr:SRPBCC domain-containing protein [Bacteroidota bacterium]